MARHFDHVPSRFPVGTKLVVEGAPPRRGRPAVYRRHLEFPDGTRMALPTHTVMPCHARPQMRKTRTRGAARHEARHIA